MPFPLLGSLSLTAAWTPAKGKMHYMRDSVSLHNFLNNFVSDKAVKKDYPFLVLPCVLQKNMFLLKENSVSEHLSKLTVYIVFMGFFLIQILMSYFTFRIH